MMLSGMGTVRAPAMGRAAEPSIVVDRGIFARETAPGRHQDGTRTKRESATATAGADDGLTRASSRAQLGYGTQMRFAGKTFSNMYWKEGERNKADTVQANWLGTVLLGTSAIQLCAALDGECSKNQLAGAALCWALTLPEYVNQRDEFHTPMFFANAGIGAAMTAVLVKAWMDKDGSK